MEREPSWPATATSALLLVAATAAGLYLMGRDPWGTAPGPGLWSGDVTGPMNSQRLADPYSFTHIVHGLLFYLLFAAALEELLSEKSRLLAAVSLEGIWELVENSPYVIERFRANTIAQGYYGDSILNSTGDVLAMVVGFVVAMHLRNRWVALLLIAIEGALLLWIRDNMTLNLVMLVYPLPGVREWQGEL